MTHLPRYYWTTDYQSNCVEWDIFDRLATSDERVCTVKTIDIAELIVKLLNEHEDKKDERKLQKAS